MENVGFAALQIIPSMKGFESKLTSGTASAFGSVGAKGGRLFGDSAGRSLAASFKSHAKHAAILGAGALGAVGVAAFKIGKDSIAQASDLNESLNAVNVTYGKQADAVKRLGREAATNLGLNNVDFNALSVRFSSFAKTISGGDGPKVVKTLDDLTTRAGDFASVMNLDVSQAAELFQSGLAGESEPLRAYGIDLSAATVASYAYSKGIAASGEQLTQAQKVQATYGLLMKDTEKNAGDFKNTSDQLANSQRILSARMDNAKAALGKGLLPILTKAVGYVNKEGVPAFNRFAKWFNKDGIPALEDFYHSAKPVAEDVLPAVFDLLKAGKPVLKVTAGLVGDLAQAFTKIPKWGQVAIAGGLLAGKAGGFKLAGGLLGGSKGGLLGGISKAAPLPVLVTNPGFGVGGGKTPGVVAGGGKLATAAKLTLGIGAIYLGGKAFKDSGIPQKISSMLGGDDLGLIGKTIDGDKKALAELKTRMKAASKEWDTFSDNSTFAFDMVDEAISKAVPLVRRYQQVLGQTPKQVATTFQINGIDRAVAQADTLIGKLRYAADVARGLDNGATYQHGGLSGQIDQRIKRNQRQQQTNAGKGYIG